MRRLGFTDDVTASSSSEKEGWSLRDLERLDSALRLPRVVRFRVSDRGDWLPRPRSPLAVAAADLAFSADDWR